MITSHRPLRRFWRGVVLAALAALCIHTLAAQGIRVALASDGVNRNDTFPSIRTLLLSKGYSVDIVTFSQLNSVAAMSAYQVICIGDSGGGDNGWSSAGANLKAYVQGGGGLVASGWIGWFLSGQTTGLAEIIPIVPTTGLVWNGTFNVTAAHPITTGVGSFFVPTYSNHGGGAKPGTTTVGTVNGTPAATLWQVANGRVVHLAPIYFAAIQYYNHAALWNGSIPGAQKLLLNSIEWAANSGIGVNFSAGSHTLAADARPGIIPSNNWNNVAGGSGSDVALLDSRGLASPARLSFNAAGSYNGFSGLSTPNAATNTLYRGGLYGTSLTEVSFTVTSVPYSNYDVYVYADGYPTLNTLSISNGATTYYYRSNGSADSAASALTETTSTNPAAPTVGPGQYQVFRNLSGSSFTITTGGSISGVISNNVFGFQIVPSAPPPLPAPSITSPTTATGTYNSAFTYQIAASGSPTSFGASGLPSGLSVNTANGLISGTPSTSGTFNVTLTATNATGSGTRALTLTINKATATLTLGNLSHVFDNNIKEATATTSPSGLLVGFSYTGAALPPIMAGDYGVIATVDHPHYTGSASGTMTIAKAPGTITLGNLTQPYDGTPRPVTFTTTPGGLPVTLTYNGSATAPAAVGTYAVVASLVNSNYTGTATGTLTITDTVKPVLTLPANLTVSATSSYGAVVTFTASATDNVDGALAVTLAPASGSTFALGTTTVNASATDAAGNTATGSFTVTVKDTTAPVISAPADQVLEATSAAGAVASFTATATDAVNGSVAVTASPASGSMFAVGTTPVTLTATDAAGNVATSSFTITVSDTTAPVIAAQENLVAEATSASGAVVAFTASAIDLVSGAVSVTASPASGSTFALGNTTVQLTATDAKGNTATGSFTVTVKDTTAPAIAAPANLTAEATSASGAVVTFAATGTDLVDGNVSVSASPASGSTFALGATTVTLTAADAAGNTATSTFTVTVKDTTAPVLTTPASQTLEATSAAGAAASFLATATDAVGATVSYSHAPGSTFALGTTTVTATAKDAAGNTASGSFTITVKDTTAPALTLPASATLEATSAAGAVATFSASAADIVSGTVAVTLSKASGTTFALGTTTVTATAKDAANNTATGSFTITVVDTTAPVLNVPANLTLEATSAAGAVATFAATATDAVGASVSYSHAPGSMFAFGTTTVVVTAKDAANNTTSGTFTVTVKDTTAPTITSLAVSSATLSPANHKMIAITVTAAATDKASAVTTKIVSVTSNEPDNGLGDGDTPGDIEITGPLTVNLRAERSGTGNGRIYTIVVEAKDASGNTSAKTIAVSVPKNQSGK